MELSQEVASVQRIWELLDNEWHEICGSLDDSKPLPRCNRGAWFCPAVTPTDALILKREAKARNIRMIYDMGAGDCRLSYWLAEQGFNVIAYETLPEMPQYARKVLGPPTFKLKIRDYYLDFKAISKEDALFAFMGGLNKPPFIPKHGLVAEGYWEKGSRLWENGKLVKEW
jgi:hypothetical protein